MSLMLGRQVSVEVLLQAYIFLFQQLFTSTMHFQGPSTCYLTSNRGLSFKVSLIYFSIWWVDSRNTPCQEKKKP